MNFISDFFGPINAWISSRGEVEKMKYKQKMIDRERQKLEKNQWIELFSGKDYDATYFLKNFAENNHWIDVDMEEDYNIDELRFMDSSYQHANLYYKSIYCPLFQESMEPNGLREIRINPFLYEEFKKQFNYYQKKGLI